MTPANLTADVRARTQTDPTTFTDAEILRIANSYIEQLALDIVDANEDILGMILTRDLSATSSTREYALDDNVIKIKAVEAKLDGTNWVRLKELDLSEYERTSDETTIVAYFANTTDKAHYDIYRRSLFLYTGAISSTVTNGLKLWAIMYPASLTDLTSTTDMSTNPTTTTLGFPKPFHGILARLVSRSYKSSGDRVLQLSQDEEENVIRGDIAKAINHLSQFNLDRETTWKLPTGSDVWDDGYNL